MNQNLNIRVIVKCLSVCVLMAGMLRVKAEEATNAPPKPHWESVAAAQVALTRGNSHTFLGAISLDSVRKSPENEILLGGGAGYGDTTTTVNGVETKTETANYLKGYGQWNHLFSERFYAGVRLEGLRDDVADIHYRFTVSPLAGYYLIKTTNTFLSGEAGPSYV